MKRWVLLCFMYLFIALFAINTVYADIIIDQPKSAYSAGDDFSIVISLNPYTNVNGFLSASIVCPYGEVEIFKSSYSVSAYQNKNVTIEAKLDNSLLGNLSGICTLNAKFGNENAESQKFELSNHIDVYVTTTGSFISPGESISLSGTAKKSNGQSVEGFAEISVPGTNSSIKTNVVNGTFNHNIVVPDSAAPGPYQITVSVYDRDFLGNPSNKGSAFAEVKVKQIIKGMNIAIESSSITPPSNLSFSVLLYDQSGGSASADLPVTLYDSNNDLYLKKLVKSGESNLINLEYDASPGYWTIESYYNDFNAKRSVYVEEVQKASFSLVNQTLTVKNIGNVPYEKNIEIMIGGSNEIKKINLDVNEEKRLKLTAPDGSYDISISEGSDSEQLGSSYLTGNAIGVRDIGSLTSDPKIAAWFWGIIIVILAAVAIMYYRKVRNKTFTGKTPTSVYSSSPPKKGFVPMTGNSFSSKSDGEVKKTNLEVYNPKSTSASTYVSSIGGNKEKVAVIALKVKNAPKLMNSQSSAFLAIEQLLRKAEDSKARVYEQGLFRIIVFAPKLTQKSELETASEAAKTAFNIDKALKEFNKKYAIKIDYGIGGNVGEMFLEMSEGKPKFTSIGNATIVAKNAAEKANSEVLISSAFHRKVYNILKGEQTQFGLFKINSILDRSQHSSFIQKFMKKTDTK